MFQGGAQGATKAKAPAHARTPGPVAFAPGGGATKLAMARPALRPGGQEAGGAQCCGSPFAARLRTIIRARPNFSRIVRLDRRANVYNCGDSDENLYFVESGMVKTVVVTASGKRCMLDVYAPGDLFGELALLGSPRLETATTMRPVVLQKISAPRLLEAMADEALRQCALHHLTNRISEQQDVITEMVTMESERRLAARLIYLGRKVGTWYPPGLRVMSKITQEELSEMVGTTRSRVGYFLKNFREHGLVMLTSDSMVIIDERGLLRYLSDKAEI